MNVKAQIPNAITLLNLFCGCAAIICILDLRFMAAFWFLFAAGWFDFADGLVARALNVSSEHGKELDSLADMVSFGVVPGVIYYTLLFIGHTTAPVSAPSELTAVARVGWSWAAAPALLVTLFSCLRLAKFNLDTRQTENFMGVATPTSTVFATGLLLWAQPDLLPGWSAWALSPYLLYAAIIGFSYLLVSEYPMFSFKIKGRGWAGNETRIIFAVLAVALLFGLGAAAFPFIVGVYLILNLVRPPAAAPSF